MREKHPLQHNRYRMQGKPCSEKKNRLQHNTGQNSLQDNTNSLQHDPKRIAMSFETKLSAT